MDCAQCFATAGCAVHDPCGVKSLSLYFRMTSQTAVTIPQKYSQVSYGDHTKSIMTGIPATCLSQSWARPCYILICLRQAKVHVHAGMHRHGVQRQLCTSLYPWQAATGSGHSALCQLCLVPRPSCAGSSHTKGRPCCCSSSCWTGQSDVCR